MRQPVKTPLERSLYDVANNSRSRDSMTTHDNNNKRVENLEIDVTHVRIQTLGTEGNSVARRHMMCLCLKKERKEKFGCQMD